MPHTSRGRLDSEIKNEKGGTVKFRLLACSMRKSGKSIRKVAGDLHMAYSTVRDSLVRMHKRGLAGRFDKRRRGRKRVLSNADLKKLKGWLAEGPEKQ